jgi:TonB family protein
MKTKILYLLFMFFVFFGCEEEKQIEVITDYDQEYIQYKDLDKPPQQIKGNSDSLITSVMTIYDKKYPFIDKVNEKPTLEYRFLINENGMIDKIIVGKKNDPEINQFVFKSVNDWKYTPAEKNDKVVKSQLNMILSETANLEVNEKDYKTVVDEMPQPVGGMKSIQEKIIYPETAKQNGIEGKVFLTAFINEVGNVVSVRIIKGFNQDCSDAAMQAVLQTKFIPGKQNGSPVKVQVTIPIIFKLN